jgi:DNA-binding CsgD family transcriptional regulator
MATPAESATRPDCDAGAVAVRGLAALLLRAWDADPDRRDERLAGLLSALADPEPAAEDLATALEGLVLEAGRAGRGNGSSPSGVLSQREVEVLALVAQGLTNRQIAGRLYLSQETVKTYVSRMYAKLGVTNRASAVVWALQRGLLPAGSIAVGGSTGV